VGYKNNISLLLNDRESIIEMIKYFFKYCQNIYKKG